MKRDSRGVISILLAGAPALAGLPAASAGELDGRWALLQSTTTVADVPIAGKVYATTRALSVHDVTHVDGRMRGSGALCAVTIDSGTAFVDTILPPALRRVLPQPTIDARVSRRDGRLALFQSTAPVVLGARLARDDEPLPTRRDDPRVIDQDEDGAPGVTVRVEGIASGDIHVVQRTWARLDGNLRSDGTFAGIVRHGVTQSVLGATSPFLRDPPRVVPAPELSWFRLGRLPPEAGCSEARALATRWAP